MHPSFSASLLRSNCFRAACRLCKELGLLVAGWLRDGGRPRTLIVAAIMTRPRGRNSVGRVTAFQAVCRRFESGRPLSRLFSFASLYTSNRRVTPWVPQRGNVRLYFVFTAEYAEAKTWERVTRWFARMRVTPSPLHLVIVSPLLVFHLRVLRDLRGESPADG